MLPHPGWGGVGWVRLDVVHPGIGVGTGHWKGTVMSEELTTKKLSALNRLKTVRGHLDGIIRMLESDAYCVDVMKQISAVQSALERTNRVIDRKSVV